MLKLVVLYSSIPLSSHLYFGSGLEKCFLCRFGLLALGLALRLVEGDLLSQLVHIFCQSVHVEILYKEKEAETLWMLS